jgi:hypothetical protein
MAKDSVVPKLKINHKGVFDLGELYKNIKGWLEYNGYGDEEKNFQEASYTERIKGESKQIESKWVAQKNADDYFAHSIEITFAVVGLVDIETEKDGKKIKSQKGDLALTIKADLIRDYADQWSPFMRSLYENLVVRERKNAQKTLLYGKVYALHDEIKEYLSMNEY